jgi:hypothetical protein
VIAPHGANVIDNGIGWRFRGGKRKLPYEVGYVLDDDLADFWLELMPI